MHRSRYALPLQTSKAIKIAIAYERLALHSVSIAQHCTAASQSTACIAHHCTASTAKQHCMIAQLSTAATFCIVLLHSIVQHCTAFVAQTEQLAQHRTALHSIDHHSMHRPSRSHDIAHQCTSLQSRICLPNIVHHCTALHSCNFLHYVIHVECAVLIGVMRCLSELRLHSGNMTLDKLHRVCRVHHRLG